MRVRRDPDYTVQALLNKGRRAWVERMMNDKESIIAVQTLRNAIMGATFFASTAVALIVGTITLSTQGDKLAQAWSTLSPIGAIDEHLWLLKLLVLLSSVRLTFEQIQLVSDIGQKCVRWIERKQLMQWSCLEHSQTQDL